MVRSKDFLTNKALMEHFDLTGELPAGTWVQSTLIKGQTGIVLGPHWPRPLKQVDFSKVCWERDHPEWLVLITDEGIQSMLDLRDWMPIRARKPSDKNPTWIQPGMLLVDDMGEEGDEPREEVELEIADIRGSWALLQTLYPPTPADIQFPYYGIYKVAELESRFTFRLNRLERVALLPDFPL